VRPKQPIAPRVHTPALTASRLELAGRCPGSFALPHYARQTPEATQGTMIHEYLALLINDGLAEPECIEGEEARAVCSGIDPAAVLNACGFSGAEDVSAEVAIAYDPDTGAARRLGAASEGQHHRDYTRAPEGWVCGTADVVAHAEDAGGNRILVTDWKTGAYAVSPPESNPQLRFLALAAAKAHGARTAAAQIIYVDRYGGLAASAPAEFGPEELGQIEAELRDTLDGVALARSRAEQVAPNSSPNGFPHALPDPRDLRVGAHCRMCPAFSGCPAQAGAAQALLEDRDVELTDQNVAEAWAKLQAVEAATKRVRASLMGYLAARDGEIDLENGKTLRLVESRREKIDPELAMPILRDQLGFGGQADEAVSVSKTALKRLAGSSLPEVMAALEDAGAVEVSHSESLRETGAG